MGQTTEFTPEKLIIGIIYSRKDLFELALEDLEKIYGPADFTSELIDFQFTDYYTNEMGHPQFRIFIAFAKLIDPQRLPEIKIRTNQIEDRLAVNGQRKVNLDPGTLALSRFVLATTKEGSHRIPISKGIYGEVTLQFSQRDFQDQQWTYPDYRSRIYKDILLEIREIYKNQLKTDAL